MRNTSKNQSYFVLERLLFRLVDTSFLIVAHMLHDKEREHLCPFEKSGEVVASLDGTDTCRGASVDEVAS